MCNRCDIFNATHDYEIADCPAGLEAEEQYYFEEGCIADQDDLEARGTTRFNDRLARKNSGDPCWDEIPF